MPVSSYYEQDLISILTPTRERPENVARLVTSIFSKCKNPDKVEVLFYVDEDDDTFPNEFLNKNVKKIVGPKIWLSLMQNVLYANAKGEIIMYAGDDIEFGSKNWDVIVRERFNKYTDKICVVYGNDNATHGEAIAIHAFLHRNWINAVGCWVAPGRGSLYDFWITEVGRKLGRLEYVPELQISHIHYRQGQGLAPFDATYKRVYAASRSWVPKLTYRRLKRERRIDLILLSEAMNSNPPRDLNYLIADFVIYISNKLEIYSIDRRRVLTLSNLTIVPLLLKQIFK
jgi:hypothetical protein